MRLLTITVLFLFQIAFPQSKEGAWENIRSTNQTFVLKTGEKKIVKSADLPTGTTEVVVRITLLDDNQKISSSLVSVLKSIPDPTGISQGAAGGVFLLSTISGDDKCKYAIFKSEADAQQYVNSANKSKACFVQGTPTNKEIMLLAADSKCLEDSPKNLFFVFESDNYIFKEKIVLEIVPWVSDRLSRGWNVVSKKEVLAIATALDWTKSLSKKESFYAVFLENIQKNYTYYEFKNLLPVERTKAIDSATEESLQKSGESEKYYNSIRSRSYQLFEKSKVNEAISLIETQMIAKNRASYKDYGILGDYHLLTKQFSKAEGYYKEGLKLNPTEIQFQLNLAHVYLFTDRLSQAKEIHKKYYRENVLIGKSWIDQTKEDFADFEKRGIMSKDFKKILRIIE